MNRQLATIPLAGIVLAAACTGPPEVLYQRFIPMVITDTWSTPITVEARVNGAPSAVMLALNAGGSVALADDGTGDDVAAGDGVYTATLPASAALHAFTTDDVNRNFVGYLRTFDGDGAQVTQHNLFIDILTSDIPPVPVIAVSATVQHSTHLVNIVQPTFFDDPDLRTVAQAFYAAFPDNYDFLNIVYEFAHFANRNFGHIQNDVGGIGVATLANQASWGSADRLAGRIEFPIPTMFDGASPSHQHELGHRWINHLSLPPLEVAVPHWPLSDLAQGIMGWGQGIGGQGLHFHFDLVPSGADYLLVANSEPPVYSDLSLYLMGLVAPSDVGPHFVFDDQAQTPSAGGALAGPVTTVGVNDVISALGPRVPDETTSQKKFRIATILVSREGLVPQEMMRLYDHFAARAEEEQPVEYSDGFSKGQANPFHVATGNRAWLDMRILHSVLVDASRDGGVWWSPQAAGFDPVAPHQGKALADYLRTTGYTVEELPRSANITPALLAPNDFVIRAVGWGHYTSEEIAAYHDYVSAGGRLLLLADHALNAPTDQLALSFKIVFDGITRGANLLDDFGPHPITLGVTPLTYLVGSAVIGHPSAQIIGKLSASSFGDLDNDGVLGPGEPAGPVVLGVLPWGDGVVVFCGDTNLWETVPQPLTSNFLAWIESL